MNTRTALAASNAAHLAAREPAAARRLRLAAMEFARTLSANPAKCDAAEAALQLAAMQYAAVSTRKVAK